MSRVEMMYKPERALTRSRANGREWYIYYVEMMYKPERALTYEIHSRYRHPLSIVEMMYKKRARPRQKILSYKKYKENKV